MRKCLTKSGVNALLVAGFGACGLALASAAVAAQMAYGGLVGVVRDGQGGVLPGATVTITETGTNLTRETVTDSQGAYNFVNVLAGRYDVKVSLTSFREAVRTGVPVTVGQISRVEVALEVGALTETVTVQSDAQLLQTDRADVRTELRSDEITNLPLNQVRNYQSLVVLVPGSLPPTFQNAETDTPQRSLNMTVNGQSGNANATRTDGTANTFVTMPHHTAYVSPAETIETVSITSGSMDAEQGMAAGAAINVVTKSGTNSFKGSAFEFFNNEDLNATPYYFGRGAPPTKLPIERQIFGGTLGGPIRRNQVFFFGSYEGYLSRLEQYAFFSVPDAALRNGDFRNAFNADETLQRIYDPSSAALTAAAAGRVQFPGNMIPADRVHPIARTLLAMYPLPNVDGTGAGGLTNNYRTVRRNTTDRHNFDFKLNWNRTRAHQIWGKVSHMSALVDDLYTFPIGASDDDGGDTDVYHLSAGHTWTLSPTLLLDGSFGIAIQDQFVSSPDFNLGMIGLDLGVPGTNDQGRGDPRYAGMPQFSTGFTALGNTPSWSPIYRHEYSQSLNHNVTKLTGPHDLKAGYFLNHLTLDDWQPSVTNPRGIFTFASNATRTFGTGSQTDNFYNQYAAFLLGLVGTAGKGYQYQDFTGKEFQHALYVRDRWTPDREPHARPGGPLGVLPDPEARGVGHGAARSEQPRDGPWRTGRQSQECRARRAEGPVRAAARRNLPPRRQDGGSRRLRPHLRRAEHDRGARVLWVPELPADAERDLPTPGTRDAVRVVRHAGSGHPAAGGSGRQHGPAAAAQHRRHSDRHFGFDETREDPLVERGIRAASAARLGRRGVRAQPCQRCAHPLQHQRRADAGRRWPGPSVSRVARAAACGGRVRTVGQSVARLQGAAGRLQPSIPRRPHAQGPLHLQQFMGARDQLRAADG
ncbi:MAG: carboxypeptidase regulatory-like domain-containing protein [Vicinamibacterales bacterium]